MNPFPPEDVWIETERLALSPLVLQDADAIFALFGNWSVVRFLSMPPWPYVREDARSYVEAVVKGTGNDPERAFAIRLEDKLIGTVGIRMRPASDLQRGAGPNIGYWLGEPFWGRGYMTEAARGLIAMIFETHDNDMIYSGAFTENTASLRVQEKIGFLVDGETTLFSRPRNGTFPHTNTILTRARFQALHR
jgi:RimJ/RimL family protein N-acetyltransferase